MKSHQVIAMWLYRDHWDYDCCLDPCTLYMDDIL